MHILCSMMLSRCTSSLRQVNRSVVFVCFEIFLKNMVLKVCLSQLHHATSELHCSGEMVQVPLSRDASDTQHHIRLHLVCICFAHRRSCHWPRAHFWSMAHRPKQSSLQIAKAARDCKAVLVGWQRLRLRLRFRLKFRAFQVRR